MASLRMIAACRPMIWRTTSMIAALRWQPVRLVSMTRPVRGDVPAHVTIRMPALSPTMTAGNLGTWHKKIGDAVNPGDVLVEVETDKAQMDFECQEEGFLAAILVDSGSKDVAINTPIAVLAEREEDVAKLAGFVPPSVDKADDVAVPSKQSPTAASVAAPSVETKDTAPASSSSSSGRIFASPIAKMIAGEKGVDLAAVTGTGPHGRIVKADVEAFKAPAAAVAPKKPAAPIASDQGEYEDIPLSNMRKVIAERLSQSKSTIPHYYLTAEIEMDKVMRLRETFNGDAKGAFKLSINDFIVKASALSLNQVPDVNSAWMDTFIRRFGYVDISVAVSTPSGLITPIVKDADKKGLSAISNNVKDLASRARDNKLLPHEYQGGTFTISNLGMFGVKQFTAIINPPQSCILAVGNTAQKLVSDPSSEKGFSVVHTMHVTLSCDHRTVDGAVGAQWLAKFKEYMENPLTMML